MMLDHHELIRDAVASYIRTLLPNETVLTAELFDPRTSPVPCIAVTYEAGSEQIRGGTDQRDDVAFPVLVCMHGYGPPNLKSRPSVSPTLFRATMRAAFHLRRPISVEGVYQTEYQGQPILNLVLPQYEKLDTAVVVTAIARLPRGVS